jgi:hypothetical protein
MLQFFGSEVHARLAGAGWTSEWIVPEGSSATDARSGVVKLEMWSVVHGDTLTCATDQVAARESCFQPIIGTGQTCSLTMDLAPDSQVSIRFRLLPQERCELAGAPASIPQPGEGHQHDEARSRPGRSACITIARYPNTDPNLRPDGWESIDERSWDKGDGT